MWREIYHEFRRWAKVSERAVSAYKRTEITMETDRVFIIRNSHSTRGWCRECDREVDMVGVKEAEVLRGKAQLSSTQPILPGCGASRGVHWFLASDGSPRVCLESVLQSPPSGAMVPLCLPADQTSFPAPELGAPQLEAPRASHAENEGEGSDLKRSSQAETATRLEQSRRHNP